MADLELTLSWLGMSKYLDRFLEAGFDSWETILEVTENDLEILNVDLGSRRKLQREISNTKRLAGDPAFVQPLYNFSSQQQQQQQHRQQPQEPRLDGPSPEGPTKRGYRHHPKPDKSAPERPYSAYVLFSNYTREYLKAQNLTFTDLSKTVGERWQTLSPDEKEAWKQKAAGPWEEYKDKVAAYQNTAEFQGYQKYVAEFKANQESKRPARRQSTTQSNPATMKPPSYYPSGTSKQPQPDSRSVSQGTPGKRGSRVAIKRLKREEEVWGDGEKTRSPRIRQACEPCRRKKTKCHGEQPACRQCKENGSDCQYDNGKNSARREEETENLWQKVKAYEALLLKLIPHIDKDDEQAIQDALLLPPQLEDHGEKSKVFSKFDEAAEDDSSSHGEDSAERVGSMGSTEHVDQRNFVPQGRIPQETPAFAGQASDTRWLQKLERELSGDFEPAPPQKTSHLHKEDKDMSLVGGQLYPFELPLKETANALVNSYFNSVHLSFPVLDKQQFVLQYRELYNTTDTTSYKDHTFVAIAHLVFAIGAVHAHLVKADWAGDSRDHMLYFANARVLAVDSGVLNDTCYIGQVQVFGLGAMYLLVTDQINRAFNLIALAVRSAQSIGLHLDDVTPGITTAARISAAKAWLAVTSLENMLTVMTGRPSMINQRDCTVSLARIRQDEEESSFVTSPSEASYQTSAMGDEIRTSSSTSRSVAPSRGPRQLPPAPTVEVYFKNYTELCSLAKNVVSELYHPGIRQKKWVEIQTIIENSDKHFLRWREALEPPFDVASTSPDPTIESCRVAIRMLFHSTRTLINRPCLCRLNERIAGQSRLSKRKNSSFATTCVDSARSVLDLILNKPDAIVLQQGAMWWMTLHHLKRALIVLLLELSFRAEHMPAEAAELLSEAKAAVNWLRHRGSFGTTGQQTWVSLSRLLYQAAQKVGGDTADIVIAPEDTATDQQFSMDFGDFDLSQPSGAYDPNDPTVFPPLGLYGGFPQDQGHFFDELAARNEWDEFGFPKGRMGGNPFGQGQDFGVGFAGDPMDVQMQSQPQPRRRGQQQGGFPAGGGNQRGQMGPSADEQNPWIDFSDIGGGMMDQMRRR